MRKLLFMLVAGSLVGCTTAPTVTIPELDYSVLQFSVRDLARKNQKLAEELEVERAENLAQRERLRSIEHPYTVADQAALSCKPGLLIEAGGTMWEVKEVPTSPLIGGGAK